MSRRPFPPSRPPRILWARLPIGAREMAEYSQLMYAAADLILQRRWRREVEAGNLDGVAAAAQAMYEDWEDQQNATVFLGYVVVIQREFGWDGVAQVRARHAYAGAWR